MSTLALDTSTRYLSLALEENGTIWRRSYTAERDLARHLPELLDKFLTSHKTQLKSLKGIVVGLGPGSFTGLRVGASSVKALAYSLKLPVYGVSSLDAIAYGARKLGERICVLMDAKRNKFYASIYLSDGKNCRQKGKYFLCDGSKALQIITTKTVVVGDGIPLLKEKLLKKKCHLTPEKYWKPQACHLFPFKKKKENIAKIRPLYLYPKDCQVVRQ